MLEPLTLRGRNASCIVEPGPCMKSCSIIWATSRATLFADILAGPHSITTVLASGGAAAGAGTPGSPLISLTPANSVCPLLFRW